MQMWKGLVFIESFDLHKCISYMDSMTVRENNQVAETKTHSTSQQTETNKL